MAITSLALSRSDSAFEIPLVGSLSVKFARQLFWQILGIDVKYGVLTVKIAFVTANTDNLNGRHSNYSCSIQQLLSKIWSLLPIVDCQYMNAASFETRKT